MLGLFRILVEGLIDDDILDSVPSEMGTVFTCDQLVQHNPAIVPTAVEAFIKIKGESAHYTTYQCLVEGLANVQELVKLRQQTSTRKNLVEYYASKQSPISKRLLGYEPRLGTYILRFPGADASIVKRSQVEQLEVYPEEHKAVMMIHFSIYLVTTSCLSLASWVCWGLFLQLMIWIPLGKQFLLTYPRLCTLGTFSHEGPTQAVLDASSFSTTFLGQGILLDEGLDEKKSPQAVVRVTTRISGPEAGYVATPIMLNECAFRVLAQDLHVSRGNITTASAFRGTQLIPELHRRGIRFDVVSKPTTTSDRWVSKL